MFTKFCFIAILRAADRSQGFEVEKSVDFDLTRTEDESGDVTGISSAAASVRRKKSSRKSSKGRKGPRTDQNSENEEEEDITKSDNEDETKTRKSNLTKKSGKTHDESKEE